MPARKVIRSIHEGARDLARDIATTDAYVTSRRQRKKVEMLFACGSAWKRDPGSGVIGVEKGPLIPLV